MSTILLPKTQHLVVFQEVIRSGSIGSAAKELGLTQPAVSKIINDIEDYFGVELVVRKNTGVTLTPAGQLLLSRSESITIGLMNFSANRLRRASAPRRIRARRDSCCLP